MNVIGILLAALLLVSHGERALPPRGHERALPDYHREGVRR